MKLSEQILLLGKEGYSYNEIKNKLNCSKGVISYHLGKGQKQKASARQKNNILKSHPYKKKISRFTSRFQNPNSLKLPTVHYRKIISFKIRRFFTERKSLKMTKPNFTVDDVINKFGENPKCGLTGKPINIKDTSTYNFDHIIPVSRGGENSLDNLQITLAYANKAKRDMLPEEFLELCKDVLLHHNYKITDSN